MKQRILGTLLLLMAASPASAATLHVRLIPALSRGNVWRFEVVNASVDTLDVVRLTAILSVGGHRLWAQPVGLTPSVLRPGEAGWVSLYVGQIPTRSPVRIDWELTWNPHSVPVLQRFLRTERVASLVINPAASTPAMARPPTPMASPPVTPSSG